MADQLQAFRGRIATGRSEDEEEEDERQGESVVQPGLEVERVTHLAGYEARSDDCRGHDGIGRRKHRGQQEGLRPGEVGEERFRRQRQKRHRYRHRDHQGSCRRAPMAAQQLALDEHAVGEEGEDQGELDQLDDRLVRGVDVDDVGCREGDSEDDGED
jgi:hypothetical protein